MNLDSGAFFYNDGDPLPIFHNFHSPNYYEDMKIKPRDFIEKNNLDFFQGNVLKYICRYKHKDGVKDLEKAKKYIDFMIQYYNEKP